MAKIEDFEITEKQEKAFNKVVKAIREANKLGLSFYGKQWHLTAYQTKAIRQACDLDDYRKHDKDNPVPNVSASVLADCGADDTEYFPKGFITEE